jgi:hypothetical protein
MNVRMGHRLPSRQTLVHSNIEAIWIILLDQQLPHDRDLRPQTELLLRR